MKEFGDKGHDYERAAEDDAALEEGALERIDSLLAERLQHKIARRFDEARRARPRRPPRDTAARWRPAARTAATIA